MGLRPVSVYFGDTVNYAKGFYTAAKLTRSLFLAMGRRMVVLQPYAMVCQIQRHPILFSCYVPLFISVHCGWLCNVSSKGITIFLS